MCPISSFDESQAPGTISEVNRGAQLATESVRIAREQVLHGLILPSFRSGLRVTQ